MTDKTTPPVTVIRIGKEHGSFGYGAKIKGNTICIPFNPAVIKIMDTIKPSIHPMTVGTMPRIEFNNLQDYGDAR